MTPLEGFLVFVIIVVIAFLIYFYFRGSSGKVSLTRPIESRVDEYLDRRFELMIDEWSLVDRTRVNSFSESRGKFLLDDETRVAALKDFKDEMGENLSRMEERLNALETQIDKK
jgi:hypothetical protein